MSYIGSVFNKALGKSIKVYLSNEGAGFRRLTGAIQQEAKDAALEKTKSAFEDGKLFKEDDMKNMEQITITYVAVEVLSLRSSC